jgi:hypothetical protein
MIAIIGDAFGTKNIPKVEPSVRAWFYRKELGIFRDLEKKLRKFGWLNNLNDNKGFTTSPYCFLMEAV